MVQINFKRGFQRIFSVICLVIILIGGFISWNNAVSDMNIFKENNIQLQCIKEVPRNYDFEEFGYVFKKNSIPLFFQNEVNNEIFILELISFKYSPKCELNKKYLLTKCLKNGDYISNYNNNFFIKLKYNIANNSYIIDDRYKDIEINEFAKILNMKVINTQWYEYIPAFVGSFLSNFAITLIVAGCVYGIFLLLVWIFAGFKKGK